MITSIRYSFESYTNPLVGPVGGVHINRRSTTGINVRGSWASYLVHGRSIGMRRSMMELDSLENM
jgi:hypothetical protein